MKEKLWDERDAADSNHPARHRANSTPSGQLDVLVDLAGEGSALEFAIGTGRIGLPLAERGVPVTGLENSTAMAARLREKDLSGRARVTTGDMATGRVADAFQLVHHFVACGESIREATTPWRFVWPSELALKARLAGMALHARWADWARSPFTSESTKHVSVWQEA